jgi:hypothetical protein
MRGFVRFRGIDLIGAGAQPLGAARPTLGTWSLGLGRSEQTNEQTNKRTNRPVAAQALHAPALDNAREGDPRPLYPLWGGKEGPT